MSRWLARDYQLHNHPWNEVFLRTFAQGRGTNPNRRGIYCTLLYTIYQGDTTSQMAAGPGIPGHCPVNFDLCVLISRGPDAKTHGHQHIAYAYTDVRIAYSVVTKYAFCNCALNAVQPSLARLTQLCRCLCAASPLGVPKQVADEANFIAIKPTVWVLIL